MQILILLAAAALSLAAVYTISPLAVCASVVGAVWILRFVRSFPRDERRWLTAIVTVAIVARLVAIGIVFVRYLPVHDDQFVGALTGDESYTMSRAQRANSVMQDVADSYDYFVAFDEYGSNTYVTAVSAIVRVFGRAPYSLRLLNGLLFVAGAVLLYQLCCDAFGLLASLGGLTALLFWPTLFTWSISLLKDASFFFGSVVIVVSVIRAIRASTPQTQLLFAVTAAVGVLTVSGLRPNAVVLALSGVGSGLILTLVASLSRRNAALAVCLFSIACAAACSSDRVERGVVAGIEQLAKLHAGHVFTVGHAYKLLDERIYEDPDTAYRPVRLAPHEAAWFTVRGVTSFVLVPLPWQLQSIRELAYLPEQIAWYLLIVLLPVGTIAGLRQDRLVTCMLIGYVAPLSISLALTNGNVGTLVRLRGLVVPFLVWLGLVGFLTLLDVSSAKGRTMLIDERGRLFGRFNLFDATIAAIIVAILPIAYGTYLLFRTPMIRISSVTRVPITNEERRVAGTRLMAKLKVRGSGFRPLLRASVGDTRAFGFVFEDPTSADVLVGTVPPGTHDLVLYDGVHEVARLPKSVTIESAPPERVAAVGTFRNLDAAMAERLIEGVTFHEGRVRLLKAGKTTPTAAGQIDRSAEVIIQCDFDPNNEGCTLAGVPVRAPFPTVTLFGPGGSIVSFAIKELFPVATPTTAEVRVEFAGPAALLSLVRAGDRDDTLDVRAATVTGLTDLRSAIGTSTIQSVLRLSVDLSSDGYRYRGSLLKPGAPFVLTTDRYVVKGTVLSIQAGS